MYQVSCSTISDLQLKRCVHTLKNEEFRKCLDMGYCAIFLLDVYQKTLSNSDFREEIVKLMRGLKLIILEKCSDKRILKKSIKVFKEVLALQPELNASNPDEKDNLETILSQWRHEYYKRAEVIFIQDSFPCSASHFLGSAPKIAARGSATLVCSDYAFLQLAEERAYSSFLCNMPVETCYLKILEEWGYILVKSPAPGDLVVYGNIDNKCFTALHYGVWNDRGKVVSKWGRYEVFEHPLAMVFECYGSAVLFLRKPVYQEVLERLKMALENCKKSASSSKDCVDQFIKCFTEVLKQKLNACHIHSLAYHFFEDWLEAFPLQVSAEFHESINIPGTAELLLNLLEDTSASVPLRFEELSRRAILQSS